MKSWKTRLGLVLTMLALVLAVSVPAVAEDDNCGDRCENRLDRLEDVFGFDIDEDDLDGDDFEDIRDFDFDDDGDGLVNEDDSCGIDDDLDGLFDEDNFTECDELIAVVEIDLDDFDLDGILDLNNDDDDNDGIFNFDDDNDDN